MIVVMSGLPGSGKSTLARALSQKIGAYIFDRDQIRDNIFPLEELDYSSPQNELASQVTYMVTEYILSKKPESCIILDGRPFSKKEQIMEVKSMAKRLKQDMKILFCRVPDEIARRRLEKDMNTKGNLKADRSFQKYRRIKNTFEPIELPYLDVDTSKDMKFILPQVLQYLGIRGYPNFRTYP